MSTEKEYCDLYDKNRTLLGKVHCRGDELAPGEFLLTVGVWVFNSRNEILLTKRHPEKKLAPNLWENTGGYVMAGETGMDAAVRELMEETGITVTGDELRYFGSVTVPPFIDDDFYVRRDIPVSDIILREGETADAKWVTYSKFRNMADTGELAPFIMEFLTPIIDKFEAALKVNPSSVHPIR